MSNFTKKPARTRWLFNDPTPDDGPNDPEAVDFDLERSDYVTDVMARTRKGQPRLFNLEGWDTVHVRLVSEKLDLNAQAARRGGEQRREKIGMDLTVGLAEVKSLLGPCTEHQIDELAAHLHAEAPNFSAVTQAIRRSAQANIRAGAKWFQFKPILIQSEPGIGKTRFAELLAEACRLETIYLDCALMTTTTSLISADGVWANSRASELIERLSRGKCANPLMIVDEFDKLVDHSRNAPEFASEKLLGVIEPRAAKAYQDPFLQLEVDLSFVNWILMSNDLDRIAQPVRDRCIVIKLPPLQPTDFAVIAEREIERRGLAPELLPTLVQAVRSGRIKSLRKLHKALDAAAAAAARPRLH